MDQYTKHIKETQLILDEKFKKGEIHNMYIPEILEGINEIAEFDERVMALRNNSERSMNTVLQFTFSANKLRLTKSDIDSIEYTPANADDDVSIAATNLFDVAKRLYIFEREDLPINKMKLIATEILENLHPDEAVIFKGIFDGSMPYEFIDKKLVKTAFPDLFPGEIDEFDDTEITTEADEMPEIDDTKEIVVKEDPIDEEKLTPAQKRAITLANKKLAKEKGE